MPISSLCRLVWSSPSSLVWLGTPPFPASAQKPRRGELRKLLRAGLVLMPTTNHLTSKLPSRRLALRPSPARWWRPLDLSSTWRQPLLPLRNHQPQARPPRSANSIAQAKHMPSRRKRPAQLSRPQGPSTSSSKTDAKKGYRETQALTALDFQPRMGQDKAPATAQSLTAGGRRNVATGHGHRRTD